jgi:hypothetical protein
MIDNARALGGDLVTPFIPQYETRPINPAQAAISTIAYPQHQSPSEIGAPERHLWRPGKPKLERATCRAYRSSNPDLPQEANLRPVGLSSSHGVGPANGCVLRHRARLLLGGGIIALRVAASSSSRATSRLAAQKAMRY